MKNGDFVINRFSNKIVQIVKIGNIIEQGLEFWYIEDKQWHKALSNPWRLATEEELAAQELKTLTEKVHGTLSKKFSGTVKSEFVEHLKAKGYNLRIHWPESWDAIVKDWFVKMGRPLPDDARPIQGEQRRPASTLKFVPPEDISILPVTGKHPDTINSLELGVELYIKWGLNWSGTTYEV